MLDDPANGSPTQPLHRRVYAQLRREIAATYKAGDILESQNVLAKRFGVSFLTVREALSVLSEEGVIARKRGHGTVVVDPTRHQHVAVMSELDVFHPRVSYFYRVVPRLVEKWLREHGYHVRLYVGNVSPDQPHDQSGALTTCPNLLDELEAGRLRGIVAVAGALPAFAQRAEKLGVPLVGAGRFQIASDLEKLVGLGIDHLLAQGRKKLAFLSWGYPGIIIRAARERGLSLNMDWLRCDLHPASPSAGWDEFRAVWNASSEKPDGLLVTDDLLFDDALHAMIEAHIRVPEQLAIATLVNRGAPFWAPFPVTRIEADTNAFAEEMSRVLDDLIQKRTPATEKVMLSLRVLA